MSDDKHEMEYIFHPRSVAIVGVSDNPTNVVNFFFLQSLLECGFKGRIYPVHRRLSEIAGLRAYPSITDIPGPVDFAIFGVGREDVPGLMEQCVAKGVKIVSLYSGGFSENGNEAGKELETGVLKLARKGGIRLIGPNCLGLYCPNSGLSFTPYASQTGGEVGYLCQSGTHAFNLVETGPPRGVHFSKVISYGNAADLDEIDFLDYLIHDPETRIIAAYIEGVKDGPRFARLLKRGAEAKPIIVFKGGKSEGGTRAISSHTGAMAGSSRVWDGVLKQSKVVSCSSIEELTDLLVTFSNMPLPKGRNSAIIGTGGGPTVMAVDECERAGLSVPRIEPSLERKLKEFSPVIGTNLMNPIDSPVILERDGVIKTIKTLASSSVIDFLLIHMEPHGIFHFMSETTGNMLDEADGIIQVAKECAKPIALVLKPGLCSGMAKVGFRLQETFVDAGFPVYPTVSRAVNAISKLLNHAAVY